MPVEETKSKEQKGFFLPIKRTPLNYNENTFEGKDVWTLILKDRYLLLEITIIQVNKIIEIINHLTKYNSMI